MNVNYHYVFGGLLLCGVLVLIVIDLRAGFCLRNKGCENGQYCKWFVAFVLPCPRCIDLCEDNSACGANAHCTAQNHEEVCKCNDGFILDPAEGCTPYKVTCDEVCGSNTTCALYTNRALCGCKSGFSGNPYNRNTGCTVPEVVDAAKCWSEDVDEPSAACAAFFQTKPKKEFTIMKEETATWFDAHSLCEGEKQMLAIIENRADQEDLESKLFDQGLINRKVWLAGSDLKVRKRFQWVAGSTFNTMKFTNWHQDEPSQDGVRRCVATEKSYWVTAQCDQTNIFVCMKK